MFRWITKSRLRTSLAILAFVLLFAIGLLITAIRNPWHPSDVPIYTGLITALVSAIGTVSTVYFAWRTDRRNTKESDLKMIQLQQQIAELQMKLTSKADPDGKVA